MGSRTLGSFLVDEIMIIRMNIDVQLKMTYHRHTNILWRWVVNKDIKSKLLGGW